MNLFKRGVMMLATKQLKEEHAAVKFMLKVLDNICARISKGEEVDPNHLTRITEFLIVFVDKCHHAKEEEILFPQLEKMGVINKGGPIGTLLEEHNIGRNYIKGLREAVERYSAKDYSATEDLLKNTQGYKNLLTQHIEEEDTNIFVLADQLINEEMQEKLAEEFEKIEVERIGTGKHEEFHELLHELEHTYLS